MTLNTSGATIALRGRTRMTSRIDQNTNVYRGMSLAREEEGTEDEMEQEEEQPFGLPVLHLPQHAGEAGPTPVAPEIRELLAALVLNIAACRRWLSADQPDIRQACAAIERMTSEANALSKLISTFGRDDRA
jgi:hypothetical protein